MLLFELGVIGGTLHRLVEIDRDCVLVSECSADQFELRPPSRSQDRGALSRWPEQLQGDGVSLQCTPITRTHTHAHTVIHGKGSNLCGFGGFDLRWVGSVSKRDGVRDTPV